MGLLDRASETVEAIKDGHAKTKKYSEDLFPLTKAMVLEDGFVAVFGTEPREIDLLYYVEAAEEPAFVETLADSDVVTGVDSQSLNDEYAELLVTVDDESRAVLEDDRRSVEHWGDDADVDRFLESLRSDLLTFARNTVETEGVVQVLPTVGDDDFLGDVGIAVLTDRGEYEDVHEFEAYPLVRDAEASFLEDVHVGIYDVLVTQAHASVLEEVGEEFFAEDADLVDEYERRMARA